MEIISTAANKTRIIQWRLLLLHDRTSSPVTHSLSFFPAEKICAMYENAVQKEPSNEEWLSHLFMSYVRLGNYKRQQQIAMALYKAKPKPPYYFWAVMSIILQATTSGTKETIPISRTAHGCLLFG